jgi:hypothetical protein
MVLEPSLRENRDDVKGISLDFLSLPRSVALLVVRLTVLNGAWTACSVKLYKYNHHNSCPAPMVSVPNDTDSIRMWSSPSTTGQVLFRLMTRMRRRSQAQSDDGYLEGERKGLNE